MFLGHRIYEDLKNIIGAVAAAKLAKEFGGQTIYLPKPVLKTERMSGRRRSKRN